MILEFIQAFMRETDDGLSLKQVFKVIWWIIGKFRIFLLTARHPISKFRHVPEIRDFTQFWSLDRE